MAGLLGVSKSQVDRDKAAGMPMSSPDEARAWRLVDKDVSRTADGRIDRVQTPAPKLMPPPAQAQLAPGAADASSASAASSGASDDQAANDPATGETDEHALAYRQDRARNERIKADRAEIELQQLRGELVAATEVEQLQFTSMRIVRDRLEMLAPRAAADLRAQVLALIPEAHRSAIGSALELHEFEARLAGLVREALADASKQIAEAGRDDDEDTD